MIYHTTRDGRKIKIKNMGDEHLINTIRLFRRNMIRKSQLLEFLDIIHVPGLLEMTIIREALLATLIKEAQNRNLIDKRFRILGNIELFPGERVERKYQITGKTSKKSRLVVKTRKKWGKIRYF